MTTDELTQCGADAGPPGTPGEATGQCQLYEGHWPDSPHVDTMGVRWETDPGPPAHCAPPGARVCGFPFVEYDEDGSRDCVCTLPRGHDGPHSGPEAD